MGRILNNQKSGSCICIRVSVCAVLLLVAQSLLAQRVFERGDEVIYQDAKGNQIKLGLGSSPILNRGKVAMIRGFRVRYGDPFDCRYKERRNWIVTYDPITRAEKTLFDQALPFGRKGIEFCVFEQMQTSSDGRTLYLVSPVYATSGSLAIVQLPSRPINYVPGVNEVYVIETGPHRGELIYSRRLNRRDRKDPNGGEYPYYPFVHARENGEQIRVVSDEEFTVGSTNAPLLAEYLRNIGGRITVNGQFPN